MGNNIYTATKSSNPDISEAVFCNINNRGIRNWLISAFRMDMSEFLFFRLTLIKIIKIYYIDTSAPWSDPNFIIDLADKMSVIDINRMRIIFRRFVDIKIFRVIIICSQTLMRAKPYYIIWINENIYYFISG